MTRKTCINNCVWGRDMFPNAKKCPICRNPMIVDNKPKIKIYDRAVITEKICTGCKKVHPVQAFGKQQSARDGYRYKCRSCTNADQIKARNDRKSQQTK